MNIETVTSASGIVAWLVEERTVPLIALRFAFDGGSAQDPEGKAGVSSLVSQMLSQGAGELNALAFQERARDLTLRLGFHAGMDALIGSFTVLSESRDDAAHLLKLAITQPRFDLDTVARERERLAISIARAEKDPGAVARARWNALAFAGHVYARPIIGTEETLPKISTSDLDDYRRRVLAKDTLRVVAVGDITPDQLRKLLDDVFGSLPAAADFVPIGRAHPISTGSEAVVEMDVPEAAVAFGLDAVSQHDPDYLPAFVLNHVLGGGGFSSRLMQEVRVKRGLSYSISTAIAPSRHASVLRGGFGTRNDTVGVALDVVRTEFMRLAKGEIGQPELDAAKSYLIGSYPLGFDANTKIAAQLLGLRLADYPSDFVDRRNAELGAVTLEHVKDVARRLLDPDTLVVTVAGNPELRSARQPARAPDVSAA